MKLLLVTLSRNRKPLIGQAIKSVLQQTLPTNKFDYLIFDNNSTDGAKKIIQMISNKYKHVHAHYSPTNLGQQKSYNKIINEIVPKKFKSSTVLAVLDDDDMLTNDALIKVHNFYNTHKEVQATYSGFSIINDYNIVKVAEHSKSVMMPDQFSKKGQLALRRRFIASNPCGHFRTYKISALRDIGGFDEARRFATDYNCFGRLLDKQHIVAKIPSVIYLFRQHGFGQVESKHSPEQTADWKYYQAFYKNKWTQMGLI